MEGSVQTASAQVFAIPELLEMILYHCPPMSLYKLKAVNSVWQHLIEQRPWFRRLLFNLPLEGSLAHNLDWCCAWGFTNEQLDMVRGETEILYFCFHPLLQKNTEMSLADNGELKTMGGLAIFQDADVTRNKLVPPLFTGLGDKEDNPARRNSTTAKWRKDVLTQPHVEGFDVYFAVLRMDGSPPAHSAVVWDGSSEVQIIVDDVWSARKTVTDRVVQWVEEVAPLTALPEYAPSGCGFILCIDPWAPGDPQVKAA